MFDITIDSDLVKQKWFKITIWDQDQVNMDAVYGEAYFRLDMQHYDKSWMHYELLNLKHQVHVHMQISREGEKDDIWFHFGKAFRSLK